METYKNKEEYLNTLKKNARLPEGFRAASISITFFPEERPVQIPLPMNLSLLLLDEPSGSFGGMYTRNAFPGVPVIVGKNRLSGQFIRAVIVNNKIANVCTPGGMEDAVSIVESLAKLLDCPPEEIIPSSTGIIGWKLPAEDIKKNLPSLVEAIKTCKDSDSVFSFAQGIMTTDLYPKIRTAKVGSGSIVGVAKGAGMIEPNMATMLAFITTDVKIERWTLRKVLADVVERTFNRISVDGDQSTSDTVLLISSGKKKAVEEEVFQEALYSVCYALAEDIVRNGEGATHIIKVQIGGASSYEIARGAGKAIINSPLVKTAIFGNDPNVGRIVSSLGDYMGNNGFFIDPGKMTVHLGEEEVFSGGVFQLDPEKEKRLSGYLRDAIFDSETYDFPVHNKTVDIKIDLAQGDFSAEVMGTDLSYKYIRDNATYIS
ncbi:MAG: arginine biosynthesis protein ArgJ [Spirochaetes bacterium]|nr:MAG: arginine biosynthesis protein ArgJ [Spirochaetota bacterium]